jgi:hypothetical protein
MTGGLDIERRRLPDGAGLGKGRTSPTSVRLVRLGRAQFEIFWIQILIRLKFEKGTT